MKLPSKPVIVLISIPFAILLFFSSNIYGYFRFKHYCSTEGGLRVYEKLERNVGWLASDYNDAHTAAILNGVAFVRYTDKDNKDYDLRYLGGNPQYESSFEKLPADQFKSITYKWRYINEHVSDEMRLGRSGYEVFDVKTNRLLVYYYMYGYLKFNPSNTILNVHSGVGCFHEGGKIFTDFPRSLSEINSAIKP